MSDPIREALERLVEAIDKWSARSGKPGAMAAALAADEATKQARAALASGEEGQ